MKKYSKEERLAAVMAVEKGESITSVAKRLGISETVIHRSIRQYQLYGEDGLCFQRRRWTAEEKYRVLEYMEKNHLTCMETGIHFGINGSTTVWYWQQRYQEKGFMGLENKSKKRKQNSIPKSEPQSQRLKTRKELLEENEYLRAEIDYLKKLNALVAEREKREQETE